MSRENTRKPTSIRTALVVATLTLAGCGGDGGEEGGGGRSEPGIDPAFKQALEEASSPSRRDFPAPRGRTLEELGETVTAGTQFGLATSIFTPGENRVAFGIIDQQNKLVYGKTAIYVASSPKAKARGPFLAPADSLVTEPRFRSQTAAAETDAIAAVYAARAPLGKPGRSAILAITISGGRQYGSAARIKVVRESPVTEVGEQAPNVATDTLASVGGIEEQACTRKPIDDMHGKSLRDVYGKRPVALLFATPQLCQSRVCGSVVDIAQQLKKEYGDRLEFIHQEVYEDNDLKKGLREPLRAFGLPTEPWLFVLDRSGKVTARLEGSFGVEEFRKALETAL